MSQSPVLVLVFLSADTSATVTVFPLAGLASLKLPAPEISNASETTVPEIAPAEMLAVVAESYVLLSAVRLSSVTSFLVMSAVVVGLATIW